MESNLGYRIDFSDFWNKMLSGEVSFSTGVGFVAQRVHSQLNTLSSDKVDVRRYGLSELTLIAIMFEELSKNINNGLLNYAECRNEFSKLMTLLEGWAKAEVENHPRSEVKLY